MGRRVLKTTWLRDLVSQAVKPFVLMSRETFFFDTVRFMISMLILLPVCLQGLELAHLFLNGSGSLVRRILGIPLETRCARLAALPV